MYARQRIIHPLKSITRPNVDNAVAVEIFTGLRDGAFGVEDGDVGAVTGAFFVDFFARHDAFAIKASEVGCARIAKHGLVDEHRIAELAIELGFDEQTAVVVINAVDVIVEVRVDFFAREFFLGIVIHDAIDAAIEVYVQFLTNYHQLAEALCIDGFVVFVEFPHIDLGIAVEIEDLFFGIGVVEAQIFASLFVGHHLGVFIG